MQKMQEKLALFNDPSFFPSMLEECDMAVFRSVYFHPSNCSDEDRAAYSKDWDNHVQLWEREKRELVVLMKIPKYAAILQRVIFDLESILSIHNQGQENVVRILEKISAQLLPLLSEKDLSDEEVHIFQKRWEQRGMPKDYCTPLVNAVPILRLRTSYMKWSMTSHIHNLQLISNETLIDGFVSILGDAINTLRDAGNAFGDFVTLCEDFPAPPMLKDGITIQ